MSQKACSLALGLVAGLSWMEARADLYQAAAAAERQDYARAFELFRPLAEIGNANAQENLAVMYVNGEGVKRDNVLGYAWAKLALENGGGDAAKSIVAQLEPKLSDATRARVIEIHSKYSNQALQESLLPDPDVPDTAPPARCQMKTVADPDSYYPAKAKIRGITGEVIVEVRVATDGSVRLPRAVYSFPAEIFEEAGRAVALNSRYTAPIENGVAVPCTMRFKVKFGIVTETSMGNTLKDRPPSEAMKIVADLRAKARAGDPDSQLMYGVASSIRPEFRLPDDKTDWFLKSAQAGVPAAQFLLGSRFLWWGRGPMDETKGRRWLEMGANGGSGAAMTWLASYLLHAHQSPEARDQGFDWMQRASGTRHREGKYLFAALLASWSDAAKRDPARALKLMDEVGDSFDYDPLAFEIRAAAFAGLGDFEKAKHWQSRAVSKARRLDWDTREHNARLEAYSQGRPWSGELIEF